MEFNFIEEVSKALDALSVERLVRESPMGSVRCKPCGKYLYTYVQARYQVLVKLDGQVYLDIYKCREQEGENYHLTNMDKFIDKNPISRLGRKVAEKKKNLAQIGKITRLRSTNQHRVAADGAEGRRAVLVGVFSGHVYTKALRRKILRALVIPVSGLRKPRPHLLRSRWKSREYYYRRWEPRVDRPRGEVMTKMMSWANADKYHTDSEHRGCRPREDAEAFRRRCRAREAEAVRREAEREIIDSTAATEGCRCIGGDPRG